MKRYRRGTNTQGCFTGKKKIMIKVDEENLYQLLLPYIIVVLLENSKELEKYLRN